MAEGTSSAADGIFAKLFRKSNFFQWNKKIIVTYV